ncbi:MAG TPA: NAD(P)-dependent oxidoreductase [Patescibacteria group bacterium]|nr:NAD(P)-dependent oxidoreductase [Patescibacteria group bacterium]
MNNIKIAVYEISGFQEEYLKTKLQGLDVEYHAGKFAEAEHSEAEIVSTFTQSHIGPESLAVLPNLKYVATRTTGFDHINVTGLAEKNVLVSNVPTYGENTVAEYAFALIIELSRKMYPTLKRVREQKQYSYEGLVGFDLKGKTLGVIGTGHIGAFAIKIAKGYSMEVLGYQPQPNEALAQEFGFTNVSLEELLKRSDIVTLHVPYMPATHHLMGAEQFALMKDKSIFINTARGGLVDTQSLLGALKSGKLTGAGLDVLENEPALKAALADSSAPKDEVTAANLELMAMANVLITPHNAFQTTEAIERILDTTADNIKAYIAGIPQNILK